jgi:hypothetical protein
MPPIIVLHKIRKPDEVPCRSLPSFFMAYFTVIALFIKNCPFIASMAASEDSKLSKLTNPYPFDSIEVGSRAILGVTVKTPNAQKVSYNNFSSTIGSRFPTNSVAPTSASICSEFCEALFTLIGFPNNLILFIIFKV